MTNAMHNTTPGGAFNFSREGYDEAKVHELTTADLEGATVYGRDDENIGSVSSLEVGTDGKITDAVIDVGGFLGMGSHSVMMSFDKLTLLRQANGSDVRINLDTTKEELKAMPHHEV